jgi:hypothetical protein
MRDPVVVAVDVGTGSATSISFLRWLMSGGARERETREEA